MHLYMYSHMTLCTWYMNTEQAQLHMIYIYIQPVAMVTYVYASNVGDKSCLSIQFDEAISTTPE